MVDISEEEALKAQKSNCIFCKIIKGEISSKKVYEDDLMLAIMDINPAVKGHVLVMPKEHYPILPLIPESVFFHLFTKSKMILSAVKKAMIAERATLFIANGGAAGQQSPHFLFHIMPREEGDGLDNLDIKGSLKQSLPEDLGVQLRRIMAALSSKFTSKISSLPGPSEALNNSKNKSEDNNKTDSVSASDEAREQLLMVLESNPQLKELIIKDPVMVEDYVKKSPELSVLFEGIDIKALSKALASQKAASRQPTLSDTMPKADDVPDAASLSNKELYEYIKSKPRLYDLLKSSPEELVRLSQNNPRVNKFFSSQTPFEVAKRIALLDQGSSNNSGDDLPVNDGQNGSDKTIGGGATEDDVSETDNAHEGLDFELLKKYIDDADGDLE